MKHFEFSTRWNQAELMIPIGLEATSIQIWSIQKDVSPMRDLPVMALSPWGKKSFIVSPWIFFYLLNQIESNCMYWLHWKSEKNRTEPNELDELKYSKSLH